MKIKTPILLSLLGFLFLTQPANAQKLDDAKKALDAEQYQNAKSQFKKLINSAPDKDENYFYLGWIYLLQDYPDSAKTTFEKGIAADPKSALSYVGIGTIAKLNNDDVNMIANFEKATSLAGKNDDPFIYIANAYLMKPRPNADMALMNLNKAVKSGAKDPAYFLALGDAYHAKLDNNNAYSNYAQAQSLEPKAADVKVAIGTLWKQANNYDGATQQFNEALTIDPNYGPAYRGLAETDLQWALGDPKMASMKIKEGTNYYKKYLDLTDRSPESQMRYADFLIQSGDYKTLEQVANDLAKSDKSNLRVFRYLAYAGYENKNYKAGLDALNKFMKEAAPKRIIPRDYLYLGRLQIKTNQDSLGALNLKKAIELDSTNSEVYSEIAGVYFAKRQYEAAGDAYKSYLETSHHAKLNDYFREGMSYYFAYSNQYYDNNQQKNAARPDSTLLTKADSAFSYVEQKTLAKPVPDVTLYRARLKDLQEPNRNDIIGLAKPFYEKYIELETSNANADERTKKNLGEAYAYLGSFYEYKEKDEAKASDNFEKAKAAYPDNKQAQAYFTRKSTSAGKSR